MVSEVLRAILLVLLSVLAFLLIVAGIYVSQLGIIVYPFRWNKGVPDHNLDQYSIMTANVGNSDLRCASSKWKLCNLGVEKRLASNLQQVKPDIIAMQEMYAPWQCQDVANPPPWHVCSVTQDPPQARRLLGNDYSIVCEPTRQFECIAVHRDAGEIIGCPVGGLCYGARVPVWIEGCDNGFSISAVTVRLKNSIEFDVVNAHPASFSTKCRAEMMRRALSGDATSPSIITSEKVLIMGDFNADPWRMQDLSTDVWNNFIDQGWSNRPFVYHSGVAEKSPPYYTIKFFIKRTVDLVVSNFAEGICNVLGETPGTMRLDGGVGNDHRAIYGILTFKK